MFTEFIINLSFSLHIINCKVHTAYLLKKNIMGALKRTQRNVFFFNFVLLKTKEIYTHAYMRNGLTDFDVVYHTSTFNISELAGTASIPNNSKSHFTLYF